MFLCKFPVRFFIKAVFAIPPLANCTTKKPRFQIPDFGFSGFGFQEMGIEISKFQFSGNGNRYFSPHWARGLEAIARFFPPAGHVFASALLIRADSARPAACLPALCPAACGLLWASLRLPAGFCACVPSNICLRSSCASCGLLPAFFDALPYRLNSISIGQRHACIGSDPE